jgi:hypothetical protein
MPGACYNFVTIRPGSGLLLVNTCSVRCNAELVVICRGYAARSKGQVLFLDCGKLFVRNGQIDARLMADALHPTAAGWQKLMTCMLPIVSKVMAG